ncbi:MAG: hypothetical protein JW927_01935 [Deltaproteobacteria bacterium]|nr:hypothetical protein [Deltaproteobacteria bacterium]
MKTYSQFASILIVYTLIILSASVADAAEYKWLKTSNYQTVLVFADIKECGQLSGYLKDTIKVILSRSDIKATISDSLVFQSEEEGSEFSLELMNSKLIEDGKILFYVYGRCIEYGSALIYQFDINFATYDNKSSQALIYSSPRHSVFGADSVNGIKRKFKKLMEDAAADYISSNKEHAKPHKTNK